MSNKSRLFWRRKPEIKLFLLSFILNVQLHIQICGQSYKRSTIVNYGTTVVIIDNFIVSLVGKIGAYVKNKF